MAAITVDLSFMPRGLRERVRSQLADENMAKLAIAKANQARLAQLYRSAAGPGTTKNGFGPMAMVIDPYFRSYFSRVCDAREMVWDDPEFHEWLKRRGEWFHVPETGTRIQVGFTKKVA